ncbi:MAG: protoporphyrinogen oxidase HemJ [Magnetospirillum sp.]|nr:protoporphyrinogen oxidase HemJ [Magnetospirillum sp.]
MIDFVNDFYLWIKWLHVVAIIAWMAGLLYLPRLFVYHTQVAAGSPTSELFKTMERRLMKAIMTPAMVVAWLFGGLMLTAQDWTGGWLHAKLAAVVAITIHHFLQEKWRRAFAVDRNLHPTRFFRIQNEVPTLLMLAIVLLVIVKPF